MSEKIAWLDGFESGNTDWSNAKNQQEEMENGGAGDKSFWRPTYDKNKSTQAIIRFLPDLDGGNSLCYRESRVHYFQQDKFRMSVLCPKNIGKRCPICEESSRRYTAGNKTNFYARKRYMANILVIKDPNKPENDGKIFKWSFPKHVKELIDGAFNPKFEGKTPIYVWDLSKGANLLLTAQMEYMEDLKTSFPKYNGTQFDVPSSLAQFGYNVEKVKTDILPYMVNINEEIQKVDLYKQDSELVELLSKYDSGLLASSTETTNTVSEGVKAVSMEEQMVEMGNTTQPQTNTQPLGTTPPPVETSSTKVPF